VVVGAALTVKRHEDLAEHVECRQTSTEQADGPQEWAPVRTRIRLPEDLVLREESGGGWDASDGNGRDQEGPKRERHGVFQTAHLAHVLLAAHRMNDAA